MDYLDILCTIIFAYNGTKIALSYNNNIYLSLFYGLVTALGGGTIRDILNKKIPFWIIKPKYLIISIIFSLLTIINYKL